MASEQKHPMAWAQISIPGGKGSCQVIVLISSCIQLATCIFVLMEPALNASTNWDNGKITVDYNLINPNFPGGVNLGEFMVMA